MEMTSAEYEELRELDRIRSDNPVLNAWLEILRGEFPAWAERHGGGWDFSLGSLVRMEELVRSTYSGSAQAQAEIGGDFHQTAAWYVGEVHNRHVGTVWQYHPDSLELVPGAWPFVIVPFERLEEFPDEDGIEPDGRPLYSPVHRLCGVLDPGNGHLATDVDIHAPERS